MAPSNDPLTTYNLTSLLPFPVDNATVQIPSPDAVVQLLTQRYRHDLTATYVGDSNLVVINPLKVLGDVSEASKGEFEDRAYTRREGKGGEEVQPHAYELACRVYLVMRRSQQTQSVVFSGLSGSGSSTQHHLFTAQLLRLSTSGKKDARIADQVVALQSLLSSFGCAKTTLNPSATRHSTLLELHFNQTGRLAGAKVLAFGLDKNRVRRLAREERTFHAFYQLLAGATKEEREQLELFDDITDYRLLATSGTYRLPPGVANSDDSIAFEDLRAAMKILGFKPRHVSSIFRLLSAILVLGNLEFGDHPDHPDYQDQPAWVANRDMLDKAAGLLGTSSDDLERALTNQVRWVRKEMVAVILKAEGADKQRDGLMSALYSILFAFVVETANHKTFPGDEAIATLQEQGGSSILQLDQPGFFSRSQDRPGSGMLVRAMNGFDEFVNNYSAELVRFWTAEREFDGDEGTAARAQEDGVRLADVVPPDGSARIELLRGGRVGGKADRKPGGILGGLSKTCSSVRKGLSTEEADEELLHGMKDHFGAHTAFIPAPGGPGARSAFGISHFGGSVTYDGNGFIEQDLDALDPEFVALLRASDDGFIAKLFSGPSLAAEVHPLDDNIIVAAQVSSQPLRRPSPIKPASSFAPTESESQSDPTVPLLDPLEIHPVSSQLNATTSQLLNLIDRTHVWNVLSLRPNDTLNPGQLDTKRLRAQVSQFLLPELVARKKIDFVQDLDYETFSDRHGVPAAKQAVEAYMEEFKLVQPTDYATGTQRVWLSYRAWRIIEDRLRANEPPDHRQAALAKNVSGENSTPASPGASAGLDLPNLGPSISRSTFAGGWGGGDLGGGGGYGYGHGGSDSVDDLLMRGGGGDGQPTPYSPYAYGPDSPRGGHTHGYGFGGPHDSLSAPAPYIQPSSMQSDVWGRGDDANAEKGGFGMGGGGGFGRGPPRHNKEGVLDAAGVPQETEGATVEEVASSRGRRFWVATVWCLTFWCPSVCLKHLGRMKRPDVRMAWREKVALCMLIGFFCGIVIFYIVVFGKLLCPNMNNAWNTKEVGYHAGSNDYWVSVRGVVYDLTKFYKIQHSDITAQEVTSSDMLELAGLDLTNYFPIPLTTACPDLVTSTSLTLQYANFTAEVTTAVHTSGSAQTYTGSELHNDDWYTATFLPKMDNYKKGPLVWSNGKIKTEAESNSRLNAIVDGKIYDLTDYFYTIDLLNDDTYKFLDTDLAALWQAQPGTDITSAIKDLNMDESTYNTNMDCIKTLFAQGETDFRLTPRCQVQPNMLLAFSILLMVTILAKFLAALQFGSKRMPELRDKFVICQVPCYTEGEESLRKTIDSLATLTYDDKRKLLMIICDGMIIGSGNDKATPRIVLDILGVDQDVDPDPLMFKSVAEGSKQLNYGKVWSGLYEVEGHVVPYIVVAKVGRPSERSRPGNRGKRDSQILSMRFLNRVHFDSEMYPLELEMYHQIKNVIGVDPQLYEYMLVIDADTSVAHDSLNRLVSAATDDSKIIGICGETKLENENESWWTMIQVYEYFISHHMAKAFESMFGSVTCLPGCFTMYRLRTADKGKPLLVSSLVVDEYSDGVLDTLHKKNLLALGEDRYLTTLILKHFPNFKTKFLAEAQAMTVAPNSWSILLSQRRRWINSTVHNLAELMFLPDMCGFCCFSMRFFVMIDLIGTLILPATFVYLIYLIVEVATGKSAIPTIALVMLAATYGLQCVIFLLKRQWQFIGWLVIYLLAYPVYSFLLPLYSFWRFDDFSWGNTRVVVGEGKSKKVLQAEEEAFDESSIPMAKFAEYQARLDAEDPFDDGRSYRSGKTQSTAGFSLATKLPPGSYHGGADYYRDTVHSRSASKSTLAFAGGPPTGGSQFGYAAPPSAYGGAPSIRGSEFGGYGGGAAARPGSYGAGFMPTLQSQMSLGGHPGSSASMLGGPPPPMGGMGNRRASNMSGLSYGGFGAGASVYSMGAFAPPQPSQSTSPTDEEIVVALKAYLASQDLMTVTKRTARDGLQNQCFPMADLAPRKDAINAMIDGVLQGRL
ncbi:chitin synthase-domain-containing protein [Leucosporidium creatinivorum]|uniref:chitin synthase n=1 Tax=Leucosporidium creatinivorum TaxID=106004 RepID=A0A1Y2FX28_9BASI|nr:chitin synthase-domain-containing protein [Leucosporidium creatinivorum]